MIEDSIHLVRRYGSGIFARYDIELPCISLHLKGYRYYHFDDQKLISPGPFLVLYPRGVKIEMDSDDDRVSWSVQFNTSKIQRGPEPGTVRVDIKGCEMVLSMLTWVSPQDATMLNAEFADLHRLFQSPVKSDRFQLRVRALRLLEYIVRSQTKSHADSAATRLRRLIEKDKMAAESLTTLSERCGYSPNHLRILFLKEYGLTPAAYRTQIRLARAMAMLLETDLSVKEVAMKCGFRQLSHFSRLFSDKHGISPMKARQKHRAPMG